jgi:hypothetical protein
MITPATVGHDGDSAISEPSLRGRPGAASFGCSKSACGQLCDHISTHLPADPLIQRFPRVVLFFQPTTP